MFLNILSFNFVPTPRKSLRFTRFRRSYLNRPAVLTNFGSVLTNHCQGYTVCCLICAVQSCQVPFFLQLFVPNDSAFALLSTPVARMWTHVDVDRQTNKCEIVINISNLTVGVKDSIGLRTTFSPNLYTVSWGGNFNILQH